MVEQTNEQPQRTQRQVSEADRARAELSDYFRFEDLGAQSIPPEPRGGTSSALPSPPRWPPKCDAVLMALVLRRLVAAQVLFREACAGERERSGWHNIFAVLRARYAVVSPSEERSMMVDQDQIKLPRFAKRADLAEGCYLRVCHLFPREGGGEREKRRLLAQEARVFGVAEDAKWIDDEETDGRMGDAALWGSPVYDSGSAVEGAGGNAKCDECGTTDPGGRRGKFYIGSDGLARCWVCQDRRITERGQLTGERLVAWVKERLT